MKLKGKDMPKWAPLAGIVVAGLLVALVGWKLVVSPQSKKAASLDAQAASVQKQITDNLAAVAAAKNTATVPKIRVADVYKLAQAIPSTPDTPDLLIELSQITKDSGVDLQSLSPSPPAADPATGQQSVPITMTVAGDFYTISDLLYRLRNQVFVRAGALEATGRLFSIDAVSLAPSSGRTETATITMHSFVYGGGAAASTGVTPPPASTDTTDTTSTDQSSGAPSAAGAP
jgi:Tfp pilus assembly protein PilO